MKIQLYFEYTQRCISIWTPNMKSGKLKHEELRHRLFVDFYIKSNNIYNHCGNTNRLTKIYPELNQ